jgi:hypothetical protein
VIGVGVRDDGAFNGVPGIDVKIAAGAIQSVIAHFEEWRSHELAFSLATSLKIPMSG